MPSADDLHAINAEEAARALAYREAMIARYVNRLTMERKLASNPTAIKNLRNNWEPLVGGPSPANPVWTPWMLDVDNPNVNRMIRRNRLGNR